MSSKGIPLWMTQVYLSVVGQKFCLDTAWTGSISRTNTENLREDRYILVSEWAIPFNKGTPTMIDDYGQTLKYHPWDPN